jgi:hypothetical protein
LGSLGARFGGERQGKWRGRRGLFIGARWRQMGQENGGVDGSHHWLKAVSRGVRSWWTWMVFSIKATLRKINFLNEFTI